MSQLFSLDQKRILVTGGTRGLGRAISLQLARSGAAVIANYVRDQESAEALKNQALEAGFRIDTVRADITGVNGLSRLLEHIREKDGGISGFIHCAATGVHLPLEKMTSRHFDFTYALNVKAFLELCKELLPAFRDGASVIAISSAGAVRAVTQYALAGSSKAALESLVRHLAVELSPRGIRVNVLSPGTLETDAWKALPDAERRLNEARSRSPIGRLVTLEEVAKTAVFLCSDASSGINGQTLVVDGGSRILE